MSKHVHFTSTTILQTQTQPSILLLGQKPSSKTKRLSAACQQLIAEDFTSTSATLQIRSCLADSQLYPIIAGHKCNRVPLVPSSLHADMALTAAEYVWSSLRPGQEVPGLNVCDMEVLKPFIATIPQEGEGQWIEMLAVAEMDDEEGVNGVVRCTFKSVKADGSDDGVRHAASCFVRYERKEDWKKEWRRVGHMVENSISVLRSKAESGGAAIMQPGLAYKCFESFVHYAERYRGMDEVVFNGLEGTSVVRFKTTTADYTSSIHLDNSCHLSGFLCNAYDGDIEDCVYVSEGWEGAKCLDLDFLRKPQRAETKLVNYVRMQEQGKSVLAGDVYTFQDGEIVSVWEGIKFKRVPRRVVNIFLPPPKQT
jgi:iterative type I PKS product template protein